MTYRARVLFSFTGVTASMNPQTLLILGCIGALVTLVWLVVGMDQQVFLVRAETQPKMADGTLLSAFLVGLQVRLQLLGGRELLAAQVTEDGTDFQTRWQGQI